MNIGGHGAMGPGPGSPGTGAQGHGPRSETAAHGKRSKASASKDTGPWAQVRAHKEAKGMDHSDGQEGSRGYTTS